MPDRFKYERARIAPEFDIDHYLHQQPGLSEGEDAILHYLLQGWRELRDPSPNFSTRFYLDENPDVRDQGINPLFHYIVRGRDEGRYGTPTDPQKLTQDLEFEIRQIGQEVDVAFYKTQAQELSAASMAAVVEHYVKEGWRKGLDPSPNFSTSRYLEMYPDVRAKGINPLLHYVIRGKSEGRRPTASRNVALDLEFEIGQIGEQFDIEFYKSQLPELSALSARAVVEHYVGEGWRKGLDPSPDFSTSRYLDMYPDVRATGMNPLLHYVAVGNTEGRAAPRSWLAENWRARLDSRFATPSDRATESGGGAMFQDVASALTDTKIFDLDFYRHAYRLEGTAVEALASYLAESDRAASPYFDPVWYREQNPEVEAGVPFGALRHLLAKGREKGCWPSRIFDGTAIRMEPNEIEGIIEESGLFDVKWYESGNADVMRAKADPLRHYARMGHLEFKRSPNVLFDSTFYARQAPEVREFKWHPLVHYILVGSRRGLRTHTLFDVEWFERVRGPGGGESALARLFKDGLANGAGPNEWFDPDYYARACPEAVDHPGGVVAHYLDAGWRIGIDPSERFSTAMYSDANPDVTERGINPLVHYMATGRAEGRNPSPRSVRIPAAYERFGEPEYGATGPVLGFDLDVRLPRDFALSVAVHLHLYYVDMAEEFRGYLSNIPVPFHLFVSVPPGQGVLESIRSTFASGVANCGGVTVASPENRGRDVAPFLVAFGPQILGYDLVLHLHSKRSPHSLKHAGWRKYLLHYTLGNAAVVTQILTAFHADPRLGVFQPPYFPEVRSQPKWGENRDLVATLLNRIGLSYVGDACPDFPAGSFFWSQVDAIRPLLAGCLTLQDFDKEAGQTDGTVAHAVERLFGLLPVLRGYTVGCRFIDVAHNLVNYHGKSRAFPAFDRDRTADVLAYQEGVRGRDGKRGRIAVVTAISGPFDPLLLPYHLEPSVDYFCATDSVTDGYGVYRLLPLPYHDADARRSARFVKTNLCRLFPGYEFVVWVDANVLIRAKVTDFVAATEAAGCPVGAIRHPIRGSYLEEAAVAVEMNLDDAGLIEDQLKAYAGIDGLGEAPLIETNFMVFDARDPKTRLFTRLWWNEINTYSRRDQLSVNRCLIGASADWHSLLPEFTSVRDSDMFSAFRHGLNERGSGPSIYAAWHRPHGLDGNLLPLPEVRRPAKRAGVLDLDVVVCVHNALEDVRACLASAEIALGGRGGIVLVDDGSNAKTGTFLKEFAARTGARLVRHDVALGYTKAANAGVLAGAATNVLLLNSDTVVPPGAFDKFVDALDRDPLLGIVGPLSNAASWQSVPSTVGSAAQTAINRMPPGMSVADIDLFFERRWDGRVVRTPLVHGFCFCVKRSVFDAIGLFDEENFPRGYGEENDFCFRAVDAGFDVGVLANAYVFHAKSKSYAEDQRTQLMNDGMSALVRKAGKPRIARAVETMRRHPALAAAREAIAPLFAADAPGTRPAARAGKRGRLFLMPSRRSDGLPAGSGFVRVLLPYRSEAVSRDWDVIELRGPKLPPLSPSDTVLVQRDGSGIEMPALDEWIDSVTTSGARLVYEVDDDLLDAAALRKRGFGGDTQELAARVRRLARSANCVAVSSRALEAKFARLNPNVILVPNALDGDLWRMRAGSPRVPDAAPDMGGHPIRIGYVGTPTHDDDLALVGDVIAALEVRYARRLSVQVVGGFGTRKRAFGRPVALPVFNDYPSFARWLQASVRWDIGIIPLANNSFNNNKSYLKFLECGALGMALVCSRGPEYDRVVRHGETGLLVANRKAEWEAALVQLIENPEERARLACNAYQDIRQAHLLDHLAGTLQRVVSPDA